MNYATKYRRKEIYYCLPCSKADSVFIEASDNATMNHWNLVANRLYYAVFHMASALLIDKGFTSKTHSGVICLLGQEFATKGVGQR